MMWLWQDEKTLTKVKMAMLLYLCNIEVDCRTKEGFLCLEKTSGQTFLLDADYLPDMISHLDWMDTPENMTQRIEEVGGFRAVDFELRELTFGKYLECDNYYQAFLVGHDESSLKNMARILYRVPEDFDVSCLKEHILLGVMLWWMAAKKVLSLWFPDFLKPADGEGTISQESQTESMRAQIRMLTKGDVTKEEYILNSLSVWTAMAELNAQAREAEEIMRKYGK